jgi:hypothetical protein
MATKSKHPKIGTLVEVEWLDSGAQLDRCGIPPEQIELTPHRVSGWLMAVNNTCIVVAQEGRKDGPDPTADNYIAMSHECIKGIWELRRKK